MTAVEAAADDGGASDCIAGFHKKFSSSSSLSMRYALTRLLSDGVPDEATGRTV